MVVIPNEARNLTVEVWATQFSQRDQSACERSLAPLGMTVRVYETLSLCGMNMTRHLQAPPALMNSLIGNAWQR